MNNKLLLCIGLSLITVGILQPNLNLLGNRSVSIDLFEVSAPIDENIKKEANDVVTLLKAANVSKTELKKLRDLAIDLGRLVQLDGEDLVITNTNEIRQANSIAGPMLKLDIKGKYAGLAKETKDVIVAAIGDDDIVLSADLRAKAVDGFNALAWAYNEASK